jgi:hypothetical protein
MTGHLLALEHLAGVLALTSRTMRAVGHGSAVRSASAAEIVPLHRTGETLADGCSCHIDELARNKMVRRDLGANIDEIVGADAELHYLALRLDFDLGEMAAQCARHVLRLGAADSELNGRIAILLGRTLRNHLAVFHAQHSDGNMLSGVCIDPGHSDFLRDHT